MHQLRPSSPRFPAIAVSLTLLLSIPIDGGACEMPVPAIEMPRHGTGDALTLAWSVKPEVKSLAVWARWRVPEGETVRTYEAEVPPPRVLIPGSPEPWRPLQLSIEVSARCSDGSGSSASTGSQIQFDPARSCPPVTGMAADAQGHLVWTSGPGEQFDLRVRTAADGRLVAQHSVTGGAAAIPAPADGGWLIEITRTCPAAARSVPAYLLVR